jgi:selenocysteine-specific elongation factor
MSLDARFVAMLADAPFAGLDTASLPIRLGLRGEEVDALLKNHGAGILALGGRIWPRIRAEELRGRVTGTVKAFHEGNSLEAGMQTQLLRNALSAPILLADWAMEQARMEGEIDLSAGLARLPGWQPTLTPADAELASRLRERLEEAGWEPPSSAEFEGGESGSYGERVPGILRYLERSGEIVQVEPGRYFTVQHLNAVITRLEEILSAGVAVAPSELRERLGISRKYLIPLLEYCDRRGFTVRSGDARTWRVGG